MTDSTKEYETLREELLLLSHRAHDVWRWGLVTIVALLGAEVVAITAAYTNYRTPNEISDLHEVLKNYATYVANGLSIFAGSVAVAMWQLYTDVVNELYRIGGYVAVFHDGEKELSDAARGTGWHIWNRIERSQQNPFKARHQQDTPGSKFHGRWFVYVCLLIIFMVCNASLLTAFAQADFVNATVSGFFVVFVAGFWTWILDKNGRKSVAMWNRRWASFSKIDQSTIDSYRVGVGLKE